ncbi:hypothetical protein C3E98_031590 [Pseudomonas sp. MWU13-2625]|nr:hypothetical protein C3E98_031590 [Pseudomonas sp. MWU13-2625]
MCRRWGTTTTVEPARTCGSRFAGGPTQTFNRSSSPLAEVESTDFSGWQWAGDMGQKYAEIDEARRIVAFYDDDFHKPDAIPSAALKISDADHVALLEGQSQGKCMALCKQGWPAFVEHRPRTIDEVLDDAQRKRKRLLEESDRIVTRHRDQVDEGIETTLTDDQYRAFLRYRRELRDLPERTGYPNIEWPAAPHI